VLFLFDFTSFKKKKFAFLKLGLVASVLTENMSEDSNSYGKATDLLHQLEDILESDALM
jgi:hypothetical protein